MPVQKTVRVPVPLVDEGDDDSEEDPEPAESDKPEPPDVLRLDELVTTPMPVVSAMLSELDPPKGSTLFDVGSGDGRMLIEAAKSYGVLSVGIELNEQRAKGSREAAAKAGVSDSVLVFAGDAMEYDLAEAEFCTMYLYPELMQEIVGKLEPGTKVVSFAHDVPDVDCYEKTVEADGQTYSIFVGVVGGTIEPPSDNLTFGL